MSFPFVDGVLEFDFRNRYSPLFPMATPTAIPPRLCEDGSESVDVYEDYVHVPNVLAHRGWKHLRITAREWHQDPQAVIRRVREGLVDSAA